MSCRARGILRKEGNSPLTGDIVEISVEHGKGMVERILPRKNSFIRPAVANIDMLIVFAAVNIVLFNVLYQIADRYIEKFKQKK